MELNEETEKADTRGAELLAACQACLALFWQVPDIQGGRGGGGGAP